MDTYIEDFWKALDELVNNSEIIIDRPKGTAHPKYGHVTEEMKRNSADRMEGYLQTLMKSNESP